MGQNWKTSLWAEETRDANCLQCWQKILESHNWWVKQSLVAAWVERQTPEDFSGNLHPLQMTLLSNEQTSGAYMYAANSTKTPETAIGRPPHPPTPCKCGKSIQLIDLRGFTRRTALPWHHSYSEYEGRRHTEKERLFYRYYSLNIIKSCHLYHSSGPQQALT